jgi:DNA-directed RNA polymerase subunit RPC12/RpoP
MRCSEDTTNEIVAEVLPGWRFGATSYGGVIRCAARDVHVIWYSGSGWELIVGGRETPAARGTERDLREALGAAARALSAWAAPLAALAAVYVCAACGAIVDAARVGPSKLARPHLAFDGDCAGCTIHCPRVVRVGGVA